MVQPAEELPLRAETLVTRPATTGGIQKLRTRFAPLFSGTGGIDSWISDQTPDLVVARLLQLGKEPLSRAQLVQLLVSSHEAGVSQGFFDYYWTSAPTHVYDVRKIEPYHELWTESDGLILSIDHLRWGLYRFYIDALLFFGNVRTAYRHLRDLSHAELEALFRSRRLDTDQLESRGPALPLRPIARDSRYLIAEVACKSLDGGSDAAALQAIRDAYRAHVKRGGPAVVSIEELLSGSYVKRKYGSQQQQFQFATDDLLSHMVSSEEDLDAAWAKHEKKFKKARNAALENTRLYLSMVEELDVYVATSMRNRADFRDMAKFCDEIFSDPSLKHLNIRYFDPTMSAAQGHVDKGLIECLMVKAAKVLVYCAGKGDSYGKDVEAAMALSQGKPVIFYCDNDARERFYREVHPLARLIEFDTGVAVGAIVTSSRDDVRVLLERILTNTMEFEVDQTTPGYLLLKEKLTGSIVRLQTNDALLRETFWNYYNRRSK